MCCSNIEGIYHSEGTYVYVCMYVCIYVCTSASYLYHSGWLHSLLTHNDAHLAVLSHPSDSFHDLEGAYCTDISIPQMKPLKHPSKPRPNQYPKYKLHVYVHTSYNLLWATKILSMRLSTTSSITYTYNVFMPRHWP